MGNRRDTVDSSRADQATRAVGRKPSAISEVTSNAPLRRPSGSTNRARRGGYQRRKPPCFQPGRSGNPRGRQKAVRISEVTSNAPLRRPSGSTNRARRGGYQRRKPPCCGCGRRRSRATHVPSIGFCNWRRPSTTALRSIRSAERLWRLKIRRSSTPTPPRFGPGRQARAE